MNDSRPSSLSPIARLVFAAALFTLSAPPALALPPADGSKCSSDWVHNDGAMACFTQGEEESRAGVKHPHYVACTAAGEIFCCVDKDSGGQDCTAVMATNTGGSHSKIWVQGILAAQGAHLKALGKTPAPSTGVKPGPARTEQ